MLRACAWSTYSAAEATTCDEADISYVYDGEHVVVALVRPRLHVGLSVVDEARRQHRRTRSCKKSLCGCGGGRVRIDHGCILPPAWRHSRTKANLVGVAQELHGEFKYEVAKSFSSDTMKKFKEQLIWSDNNQTVGGLCLQP